MTYRVVVTREGGSWLVAVPDVAGAFSEHPDLRMLDVAAREVVILAENLPAHAMPGLELEWVLDVPARDLVRELGKGWTIADAARALNAPVERVRHAPPGVRTRFARRLRLLWLSWRVRRSRSRHDEGDDRVPAGAPAV